MKRFVFGTVASFGLTAVVWEAFARSGFFSPALSPSLAVIVPALVQMVVSGSIFVHIAYTLYRILWGLGLAALLGVPVGILMGRFKAAERFVLPLVSVLSPIPSLAWVPVFILWFGLGNAASIALVFYAAMFPIILNTWTGVRSINRNFAMVIDRDLPSNQEQTLEIEKTRLLEEAANFGADPQVWITESYTIESYLPADWSGSAKFVRVDADGRTRVHGIFEG